MAFNHLNDFESNHPHSASFFDPIMSPDLHTSPRGLVARLYYASLKRLPVLLLLLAAPAFRSLFVAAHFRRLTFLLAVV